MSYIGNEPIVSATRTVTEVSATAGQTVFTANGGYTVGFIDVFVNGSKLTNSDFTATNGTTITLNEAAQASDIVRLEALGTFLTGNHVPLVGDSNITGNVNVSGNVGIGTSSPATKLELNTASSYGGLRIKGTSSASNGFEMALSSDGVTGNFWLYENAPMRFATNNTERMRIDSSGNLILGGTAQLYSGRFSIRGDTNARIQSVIAENANSGSSSRAGYLLNAFGNSWAMEMGSSAANSNALNWTVDVFGSPTVRMALTTAGAATNSTGSWGTISDARLKENITDATPKLDGLMQLRVVNYNLKSDPDIKMLGFVAQEVEQVFPGLVDSDGEMSEDGDRYKSVKTTVLIPMLVKAVQELKAELDTVKAENAEMKTRIETLESK